MPRCCVVGAPGKGTAVCASRDTTLGRNVGNKLIRAAVRRRVHQHRVLPRSRIVVASLSFAPHPSNRPTLLQVYNSDHSKHSNLCLRTGNIQATCFRIWNFEIVFTIPACLQQTERILVQKSCWASHELREQAQFVKALPVSGMVIQLEAAKSYQFWQSIGSHPPNHTTNRNVTCRICRKTKCTS